MESFEKIEELTPEVMAAYLAGDLTDRQRHQVEKLLLDDDFAGEAIDGLSLLSREEQRDSLGKLRASLNARTSTAGGTGRMGWVAAAAAVIILAGVSYIFLQEAPVTSENTPVLTESDTAANSNSIALNNEITEENTQEIDTGKQERKPLAQARAKVAEDTLQTLAFAEETTTETVFEDSVGIVLGDVSPERLSQIDAASLDTMGVSRSLPVAASELDKTQATAGRIAGEPINPAEKMLSGRIILNDGTPLSNVNVMIDGQLEKSTMSDDQGNFAITANSDANLVFTLMGLKSRSVEGTSLNATGQVVMDQEAVTLSELEITSPAAEVATTRGARPGIADTDYQAYLKTNTVYPTLDEPLTGEVVIRVTVEPDGTISNTKILRSLSEPYDIEAIRLIREGPAWEPALKKGVRVQDKVRVKVYFSPSPED